MNDTDFCLAYECLVSEVDDDCMYLCDLLGDQCESCRSRCSLSDAGLTSAG